MQIPVEASFLALIESIEDPIWSVGLDFRLIAFNRAFERGFTRFLGVAPQVGMRPFDCPEAAQAERWIPLFRRAIAEGPFRTEFQLGEGRTLELAFSHIVVDGKTTGLSVFGKNISERKVAEEAKARLAAIVESSSDAIHSVKLDGTVISWNRGAEELFGYSREEIVGKCIAILAPPGRENEVPQFMGMVAQGQSVPPFDTSLRNKEGVEIDVSLLISPIRNAAGEVVACSAIARDIRQRKQLDRKLQEAERSYQDLFDGAVEGMYRSSLDRKILNINRAAATMLGFESPADLMASVTKSRRIWVDANDHEEYIRQLDRRGAVRGFKCQFRRKDGSVIWVSLNTQRIFGADGQPLFNEGFIEDITDRRRAEMELRDSEERYRKTFEQAAVGIVHSSFEGRLIRCNTRFADLVGYQPETMPGMTIEQITVPEDRAETRAALQRVRSGSVPAASLEKRFICKDGSRAWARVTVSIQSDGEGRPLHFLALVEDINHRKAAEDEIRHLEYYDPLTRLPNRRQLLDRLRKATGDCSPEHPSTALLFIDLDNFKFLNDTLGHQTGDMLLQEASQRLSGCVREPDMVARFSGDEFVVLLEQLSGTPEEVAAHAKSVGERILATLSRPYLLDGHECLSACSIGITVCNCPNCDTNGILQQADIAMYQAKAAGRNTLRFFSPSLQAAVNARAALEEELRQAIKNDQFMLYFQPQVDYGRIVGAEALLRWNHPKRGVLGPGAFISLLEETGLIQSVGQWLLETACAQLAAWAGHERTNELTLAINISALQLRQPEFVENVLSALDRTGANPKRLKLEITESMLVDDFEDVTAKMAALKAHGVRFALDDFGTGYSSLSYLKRLPLDQLKIDISFVRDMLKDAASGSIAQAIVSLGRAMRLSVIAEGVETEEQRIFLAGMGCHAVQGYLISKPLPVAEFEFQLSRFRGEHPYPASLNQISAQA